MLLNPSLAEAETEVEAVPVEAAPAPVWGAARRFFFRLAFVYWALYCLPIPLQDIPPLAVLSVPYFKLWQAVVPWVGRQAFGLDVVYRETGSGDTLFQYVQLFCIAVLALGAAVAWTLLDRRRFHYERLERWLRVYVRFSLAAAMIFYGAVKVIKAQFPDPSLDRLMQPFGDASPMGLLWTFMGASVAYNVFAGGTEMLGGILLTFRRTRLLGALVSLGALTNVVMLNFSYDVSVKLYSSHLLLMSLFVIAPDFRRLLDFFLRNEDRPLFASRNWNRAALAFRTAYVLLAVGSSLFVAVTIRDFYQDTPKLYGVWNVERLAIDGREQPFRIEDGGRWHRVAFVHRQALAILTLDGHRRRFGVEVDEGKKTIALTSRDEKPLKSQVAYSQPSPDRLRWQGTFEGRRIDAMLHKVPEPDLPLVHWGFHWISERPMS
jgi:hypothetical protein